MTEEHNVDEDQTYVQIHDVSSSSNEDIEIQEKVFSLKRKKLELENELVDILTKIQKLKNTQLPIEERIYRIEKELAELRNESGQTVRVVPGTTAHAPIPVSISDHIIRPATAQTMAGAARNRPSTSYLIQQPISLHIGTADTQPATTSDSNFVQLMELAKMMTSGPEPANIYTNERQQIRANQQIFFITTTFTTSPTDTLTSATSSGFNLISSPLKITRAGLGGKSDKLSICNAP